MSKVGLGIFKEILMIFPGWFSAVFIVVSGCDDWIRCGSSQLLFLDCLAMCWPVIKCCW